MNRITGFKPFIIFIILAAIVTGGLVWYFSRSPKPARVSDSNLVTPRPDISYATFTLQGKVVSVNSDRIIFDALLPYQTKDGVVMQHSLKTALINSGTSIISSKGSKIAASSIKPGVEVTVYYDSSPADVAEQLATKIALK